MIDGAGPRNDEGAVDVVSDDAAKVRAASRSRPTIRLIQPVRSDEPGAARSIWSIASKCERVGSAWPTAWTTPKRPAS